MSSCGHCKLRAFIRSVSLPGICATIGSAAEMASLSPPSRQCCPLSVDSSAHDRMVEFSA